MKNRSCLTIFTTALSVLACFAFLQAGTLPPETDGANPDGCYINFDSGRVYGS